MNIWMQKERRAITHIKTTESNLRADEAKLIDTLEIQGFVRCTRAEYREIQKELRAQQEYSV